MSRLTRNCDCDDCTMMYKLADTMYGHCVASRVRCDIAGKAAALVMAMAASNNEDAESTLDDACDFARECLPHVVPVH